MEGKKKAALIIGGIILLGVVAAIVISNRPAKAAVNPAGPDADGKKDESKPSPTPSPTPAPAPKSRPMVSAKDVLTSNIKSSFGKPAYATKNGVVIYNMANQKAITAKGGDLLGVVSDARKTSSGSFIINIMRGQVKYWVPETGVGFKM